MTQTYKTSERRQTRLIETVNVMKRSNEMMLSYEKNKDHAKFGRGYEGLEKLKRVHSMSYETGSQVQ